MSRVDSWEVIVAITTHVRDLEARNAHPWRDNGIGRPLSAYRLASMLSQLARKGATLHHRYEVACNDPVDQAFGRATERLEASAEKLGREMGVTVECQRDPRGAAVKIWADRVDGRLSGVFS